MYLLARLVVAHARADLTDLLLDVVGELELTLGNELLALGLSGLHVHLGGSGKLLALSSEVRGVDVAAREEDGNAILGLATDGLQGQRFGGGKKGRRQGACL